MQNCRHRRRELRRKSLSIARYTDRRVITLLSATICQTLGITWQRARTARHPCSNINKTCNWWPHTAGSSQTIAVRSAESQQTDPLIECAAVTRNTNYHGFAVSAGGRIPSKLIPLHSETRTQQWIFNVIRLFASTNIYKIPVKIHNNNQKD